MARMGRPPIVIDKDLFENACELQCTLSEIAHLCKCSEDTIERWCKREYGQRFADVYIKYSAGGRMSLRRNQFELSKKSAAMAIFLGQQYLGQRNYAIVEAPQDDKRKQQPDALSESLAKLAEEIDESGV